MQQLLIFQSLWAMEGLASWVAPNSLEEKICRIAEAKFDGISSAWTDRESVRAICESTRGTGLQIEGLCFPKCVDDLKRTLELTAEFPVRHLDIQADVRPRTIDACIPLLEGWIRLAEQADFPIYLETHRDRMTNDLFFTLELLDLFPQIKLLADISHYVTSRGFPLPISDENNQAIREILDRSWSYHGRVASSEQVQLEISFPGSQEWVAQFCEWWSYGFRNWQRKAGQGESVVFTCELGPQPYAIAGRDGFDRSDRWSEALQLRDLAREAWVRASAL